MYLLIDVLIVFQERVAYVDYFETLTVMLGANEATAKKDIQEILEFETLLANVSCK